MIQTVLAAAALAIALLTGPPAAGDSRPPGHRPTEVTRVVAGELPCVGNAEYEAVRNGWTRTRVHDLFGFDGRSLASGGGINVRQYRACPASGWEAVQVFYEDTGAHFTVYDKRRY
jgi:hypothetical protein